MNYIYLLVNLIIIPVLVVAGRGRDGVADGVAGDRVHERGSDVRDRVRAGDRDVRDDGVRNAPVRLERLKCLAETDKRVKLINDVCNGIRMIKYYCWEKPFKALVGEDVGGER